MHNRSVLERLNTFYILFPVGVKRMLQRSSYLSSNQYRFELDNLIKLSTELDWLDKPLQTFQKLAMREK